MRLIDLASVTQPVRNWDPRKESTGTFTYVDLGSVDREAKNVSNPVTVDCRVAPSRARQLVAWGDVLVSTVRPNLNAVAYVPRELHGATASTGFCVLRPLEAKLDGRYLFHWVRTVSFIQALVRQATGASYPAVSEATVKACRILVPTLEEQRRIAAILDAADALRQKRRQTITRVDMLGRATFLNMFGNPVTNNRSWPTASFNELCPTHLGKMVDQKRQSGLHLRPYLRNTNVRWFGFELADVAAMDFDERDRLKYRLHDGDVLICEGGEPGRAAVWHSELEECYFQKALHRGTPNPCLATAEFIVYLLALLAERGGLGEQLSSATIAHLTGARLRTMKVISPPPEAQRRFTGLIENLKSLRRLLQSSEAQLDTLFASLQQRAFRGEL